MRSVLKAALLAAAGLPAVPGPLFAQCAMCYQTAASQGATGIHALNFGILILLMPLVTIIGCISWVTYQRRDFTTSDPRTDSILPVPRTPGPMSLGRDLGGRE